MNTDKLARYLSYAAAVIFVLVPFQALLTTWAGSNFGHLDLFRIWKELLLLFLAAGSLYLIYSDKKIKKWFTNSPLVLLIAIYIILEFVLGIYALQTNHVNNSALIYALIINLRVLVFFLVCLALASKSDWLIKNWQKIILWPAAIVVIFGLLQLLLPNNFLTHFGYGPNTIPAIHTVDQKPDYLRLQSTLRGPNPLGAYLVVIVSILLAIWFRQKQKLKLGLLILASLIVLYFSYSRSAWLGTILSCLLLAYWLINNSKKRNWMMFAVALSGLLIISVVLLWNKNGVVSNTLFHTSQTSKSPESSNAVRTEAMIDGIKSVAMQPIGQGPGTAGPASFRNNHPPRIAENYYVQVGQEVGIVGLVLFLAINIYIAKLLWDSRKSQLSVIALAVLAGLALVNLISHAWADDTLAYIYWGLAGIAVASSGILNKERKHRNAKSQKKAA